MCDSINGQQATENYDGWFCQEVEVGLLSAKANRLVAAEDVEAKFLARRIEAREIFEKTKQQNFC